MITENQRRTFISYSRADKEFAIKLAQALKSARFPVWLDQFDIPTGARWDNELEKALNECGIFLVVLTPDSIASENVKDEIGFAIDSQKRILPVLLENCVIPLRLRRFQYVDFTTKNYDEGVESAKQLLTSLINETIQTIPREEILAVAQIKQDTQAGAERGHREESDVKFAPAANEKKTSSKGALIGIAAGIVTVIVLGIAALSLWVGSNKANSGLQANNNPSPSAIVAQTTPELVAQVISTNTAILQEKTIIGQWERHSTNMTEYFNLQADGSYTIEARDNSTNEVIASDKGTFTYDKDNLYLRKNTESYYLDNGGDLLVLNNQTDRAWTRIK